MTTSEQAEWAKAEARRVVGEFTPLQYASPATSFAAGILHALSLLGTDPAVEAGAAAVRRPSRLHGRKVIYRAAVAAAVTALAGGAGGDAEPTGSES